jgi:hypothetical protein
LAALLPRDGQDLRSIIGVVFVGTERNREGLRRHRSFRQLDVRQHVVMQYLYLFKETNAAYSDVQIRWQGDLANFGAQLVLAATEGRASESAVVSQAVTDSNPGGEAMFGRAGGEPQIEDVFVTNSIPTERDAGNDVIHALANRLLAALRSHFTFSINARGMRRRGGFLRESKQLLSPMGSWR